MTPHIGVVGAPLVYGQPLRGTDAAPGLLRKSGLIRRLRQRGAHVVDYGDLEFDIMPEDFTNDIQGLKHVRTVGRACQKIASQVGQVVDSGRMCLLLGGDHSVSIGSVFGHLSVHPDTALIWVDAHADINTELTTESGNLHGMVLGFLMKELPRPMVKAPDMEWCKPCISSKQVGYIGLRSVDPGEEKFLRDLDICAYWMEDVRQLGIEAVLELVMKRLDPEGVRPLHLSFDVDSIDPVHVPATGTPVADGLSLREALKIARTIHSTGRLSMMDITELNPLLCSTTMANWSADVVLELILRTFISKQWKPAWRHPRQQPLYQAQTKLSELGEYKVKTMYQQIAHNSTELAEQQRAHISTEPAEHQRAHSPTEPAGHQRPHSSTEPAEKQRAHSSTEPAKQQRAHSSTELAEKQRPHSSTEPAEQQRAHSPTEPAE